MKKLLALILTLLMMGSMAAEAQTAFGDLSDEELAEFYLAEANEVVVTDTHVIFTDDSGRGEISIEKNPKNVAVLYGSLACLWYEAGGTIQLAVSGESSVELYKEQIGRDFTTDEGVTVVAEASSGPSWDIELILSMEPDLIVCATSMKGYATISGPAEVANIPVIAINYNSVQDYFKYFKVFCNLNGQPQLWDEIAGATAQRIIEIVSKVPQDGEAPRVLGMLLGSDSLQAYGSDYTMGALFNELGAINVADGDPNSGISTYDVSLEDVYAMDPDMIFINIRTTREEYEQRLAAMEENPVWQGLRAVQNDRVYLLEKGLFHNKPNQYYKDTYLTLAQLLYPDCEF